MKYFFVIAVTGLLLSCKSSRKTQQTPTVNTATNDTAVAAETVKKAATTPVVVTSENVRLDSLQWGKALLEKSLSNIQNFHSFFGKLSVSIESPLLNQDMNATVRIRKDSLIWISITGPFNIEGARILISKDSVTVLNRLNRTVEYRTIQYLQKMTGAPLRLRDIQNIFLGGPLLYQNTVQSAGLKDNQANIVVKSGNFLNAIAMLLQTHAVVQNHLTSVNGNPKGSVDVVYGDFVTWNGYRFPKERKLILSANVNASADMKYKQYELNTVEDFPFSVSSSYKVIR